MTQQLTRFDKNVAYNSQDFAIYGEDENLIKNMVVYMAHMYNTDLFGFRKLDPADFAKKMGYNSRSGLFEKVENFAQLKKLGKKRIDELRAEGKFIWETRFENCLYRLSTEAMTFSYGGKTPKGETYAGITSVLFLRDIEVYYDEKNKKKKYYMFKPSDDFITNLSRYYLKIDINAFSSLRKAGLQSLYLFLANLKDTVRLKGSSEAATPHFNLLCKLAGINSQRASNRKQYLKQALDKIGKTDPLLRMNVVWKKENAQTGYGYKPLILFERSNDTEGFKSRYEESKDILNMTVRRFLLDFFEKTYKEWYDRDAPAYFAKWLNNKEKDREARKKIYVAAQLHCFNRKVDPESKEVYTFLDTLTAEVPIQALEE